MSLRELFERIARSVRTDGSASASRPGAEAPPANVRSEESVLQDLAAAIQEGRAALGSVLPGQLRRLDVDLRWKWPASSWWMSALSSVSPRLAGIAASASSDVDAAVLLATHWNGWVREAAVPLLGRRPTPLSVGMLVVRSADWVLEVRLAAQSELREVVRREGPDVLLPSLPLVEQMNGGDARCRPFALELLGLARDASPAALRSALHGPDRRARRSSARLLARSAFDLAALDDALAQDDPVTLALVAEAALADAPLAIVERLSRPPAIARIRALALGRLLEDAADGGAVHAQHALMDRAASVRAVAQRFLQRAGVDVASLYAARLGAPAASAIAVRGLTEMTSRPHLPEIASLASHPSARVREAVCVAIEVLDATNQELLLAFARDSSRRVARRAGLALVRSNLDPGRLDRLWACAVERGDRCLFPAFTTLDRWRQLLLAARGLQSGQTHAVELAGALLDRLMTTWNRSFTSPSASVHEELGAVLPLVLSRIDAYTRVSLRHALRPFLPNL
jgi:hypothetical protein